MQEWRGNGARRVDQPELQQWYWGERYDVRGHSNRRRRHGWHRRFHQPRLSSPDDRFRLLFDLTLGDRRHRGVLRGDLLRRTRRDVSALERSIWATRAPATAFSLYVGNALPDICFGRSHWLRW